MGRRRARLKLMIVHKHHSSGLFEPLGHLNTLVSVPGYIPFSTGYENNNVEFKVGWYACRSCLYFFGEKGERTEEMQIGMF